MASTTWALTQISRLLPLDEESLKQIIDYSLNLAKDAAAEHLKNLLGDSPQALEFIASFNARRETPAAAPTSSAPSEVPPRHRAQKKKAPLNNLPPPRRPEDYGNTTGAYHKKEEEDYISSSSRIHRQAPLANTFSLDSKRSEIQTPLATTSSSSKPPPSAHGPLISDLPNVRTSSRSNSRTASPAPKTKIALSGGTPMHGASTTLTDLDSAIRTLEIQTNPALSATSPQDTAARRCDCMATRHPLLAAAPNCLKCGKVICVKEGLGPCTFCSSPLLSQDDIQAMVKALKEERGKEKMEVNNASARRAEVSQKPRPFQASSLSMTANPPLPSAASSTTNAVDATLTAAKQHRDKLLNYQSQNAKRTHVIDEAADFETPSAGQSMWSSPVERAAQLKKQQKVLREQEWNARPEYEKRRVVVSVDLVGGKVVKRMGAAERPKEAEEDSAGAERVGEATMGGDGGVNYGNQVRGKGVGSGAFGRNPLLGSLIRPVWNRKGTEGREGKENEDEEHEETGRKEMWRRVQDDYEDNEEMILDGGIYGGRADGERRLGEEERAFG